MTQRPCGRNFQKSGILLSLKDTKCSSESEFIQPGDGTSYNLNIPMGREETKKRADPAGAASAGGVSTSQGGGGHA